MTLLNIENLSISFTMYDRFLRKTVQQVIDELSLTIEAGEIVAIVGASGSGKSLLAHAILDLLPANASKTGLISYQGNRLNAKTLAKLRGKEIALIPQSLNYLDPLMPVGKQVEHAVQNGDPKLQREHIFRSLHLPEGTEKLFPFQLSGGMARRILVATAIASGAKLVIADEPTPGLHQDVIQQTLEIFKQLAAKGTAILFITHDLAAAAQIAHTVAVLKDGRLIDRVPAAHFSTDGQLLQHPYTRSLWLSLPQHQFFAARVVE